MTILVLKQMYDTVVSREVAHDSYWMDGTSEGQVRHIVNSFTLVSESDAGKIAKENCSRLRRRL